MKVVKNIAWPDADEFMTGEVDADGTYQGAHVTAALRHVQQWTLAVDGGAHVGLWTRLLAERFRRVMAVEPAADTFEALLWNLDRWRLTNVVPMHAALWRDAGHVTMAWAPAEAARKNTGARYVQGVGTCPAGAALTPRLPLDSLHLDGVGLLKLDVEGAELAALEGAQATLRRCQPVVLVEEKGFGVTHFGQRPDAVARYLVGVGYHRLARAGCDEIWAPA